MENTFAQPAVFAEQPAEPMLTTPDIYNRSIETFRGGAEILLKNQDTSRKILAAGNAILDKIKANGGRLNPELDKLANDFIVKVNLRKKEMMDARNPITQMMAAVASLFTAEENAIDVKKPGIVAIIQQARNDFAKWVAEEDKKRRDEADRKAKKDQEAINLKAECERRLNTYFGLYLVGEKQRINNAFNAITLDKFDEREASLNAYTPAYSYQHYTAFNHCLTSILHTPEELSAIVRDVTSSWFDRFAIQFKTELTDLQQQLVLQLPSKKQELEQVAEFERQRAEELKQQQEAEAKRQEALAKTEGENKKLLEEQQRLDREAEQKRLQEVEDEQKRLKDDQARREQEENDRIAREAEEKKKATDLEIEMNKQAGETMVLFEKEATISEVCTGKSRQGYAITVTHQVGFVQIFQFWFEKEGKNLPIDKIGNTKLDQMKAFCEKHAHKTSEKIESQYIKYEEKFTALNTKEKAQS